MSWESIMKIAGVWFACVIFVLVCSANCSKDDEKNKKKEKKKSTGDELLAEDDARYSTLSQHLLLQSPLTTPTPMPQVRAQASFRHTEDGVNTCAFCGFENLQRFLFCRLCTKPITQEDIKNINTSNRKNSTMTVNSSQATSSSAPDRVLVKWTSVSENRAPGRAVDRRERQTRAWLRKQWVRKIDVNGELYWFRNAVVKSSSRSSSAPAGPEFTKGYVPFFTARTASKDKEHNESKEEGNIDGQPSSLMKASPVDALSSKVANARLELVDAAKANPERLPVGNDDSSVKDVDDGHSTAESEPESSNDGKVSDSLRETLVMASSGFLTKFTHFAQAADELITSMEDWLVRITVSHDDAQLLDDSMELLAVIPRESVRCTFDVHFTDFVGHAHERYDEWLDLLGDALAAPASGIFRPVSSGFKQNLYLNPDSPRDIGDHHLLYSFAAGRFIGRAMLEGYTLSFHLALPLLKMMLGLPLSLGDVEYVDPESYKRIVDVLSVNEDADDVDGNALEKLELHFSVMTQLADAGGYEVVDLIPDGRHVTVTHDNKLEYVDRVFRYTLFENVTSQLHAFLSGFYEVVPKELLLLFDPEELDYVLCESHEINIVDAKKSRRSKKKKSSRHRKRRKSSNSHDEVAEMLAEGGMVALEIASMFD